MTKAKKKLLYITDQEEYTHHGAIGQLFNGYLKEYCDVYVVYFTKYKNSFQQKGTDYVVPKKYETKVCEYLGLKDVNLATFDFVFVRNNLDVLSHALKYRDKHSYKVGFRVSFPKNEKAFERAKAEQNSTILDTLSIQYKRYRKKRLRAQCDLFMPKSKDVEEAFYGDSPVVSFPIPAGVDPARVTPFKTSKNSKRHFIFIGRLDSLRQFEKILEAFNNIKEQAWHLTISTYNDKFAKNMLSAYPNIEDKVSIICADNVTELMHQIHDADVGIALLPDIPLFSTSIPSKIMDYYTCAIPTLMTENPKNHVLFDKNNAFFCHFEVDFIQEKLEEIIQMSEEEIMTIGKAGQDMLLAHGRNYTTMAKELHQVLESL